MMGSPDWDKDADPGEKPQHVERLSDPFWCSACAVTQRQYSIVMGTAIENVELPDYPVRASWFDAIEFCNRLSKSEDFAPYYSVVDHVADVCGGTGYRLPTEAEWEYACRAGTTTVYSFGNDKSLLPEYAVYASGCRSMTVPFPGFMLLRFLSRLLSKSSPQQQPCASKRPNPWGLYDMHGNTWEWCQDWIDLYGSVDDRIGQRRKTPSDGRVIRGGEFFSDPYDLRSANRLFSEPEKAFDGFRVVRTADRHLTGEQKHLNPPLAEPAEYVRPQPQSG